MKRLLVVLVLLGAAAASLAGSAGATPTTSAVYALSFAAATDTFTFDVAKVQGAGDLTVQTGDCCIHPDYWLATIDAALPANSANDGTGLGDGQGGLSGAVTAHPFISGSVTISWDSGVNIFPAGMCVSFTYSKSPGVEITAPAGATLITSPGDIAAWCGS
jgi:hypothetical protein